MKYRVIKRDGKFEPQVRILFIWCTIEEDYWQTKIKCGTIEEAKRVILRHQANRGRKPFEVVHEE
ncbi:hypothetical protein D3C85_293110 [compost metagenome]